MRTRLLARLRALRARQQGVAAIEFAIVAPLVFMVIFLSIEMAIMLIADASLDRAASQIVREGKLGRLQENCHDRVIEILDDNLSIWGDRNNLHADVQVYHPGQDNTFKSIDDEDYADHIVCDSGNAGDIMIFRVGYDRPGLTGFLSLLGRDFWRFERIVMVQNEP